ncbi:chaperone protein DnaJ-like [Drosophila madeirensis]|uniref:DnaJ homolog subfamily B member 9 n=1 Tax=Drosophila madeirensis TaxID=30013 RepID=A0AAU9FCT9_DROMD
MEEDLYLLLGVGKTATEDGIVKAYKRMALIYHPDKNNHPKSVEHFKKINDAFKVLSDRVSRERYDRQSGSLQASAGTRTRRPQSTAQVTTQSNIFPTLCVIGGVLLGAVVGAFAFSGSGNGNNDSDNDED